MRTLTLAVLLLQCMLAGAQQHFEKQDTACPVPAAQRAAVLRFLNEAALSVARTSDDKGHEFTHDQLLEGVASGEVCIGEFEQAARHADEAYPAGSDALASLGEQAVRAGHTAQVPSLAAFLSHGNHSFYYGVATELAREGKFTEAQSAAGLIDSPEVKLSAQQRIATSMYEAGHTKEADALLATLLVNLPAEERRGASLTEAKLSTLLEAQQWSAARTLAASLPTAARELAIIEMATGEADNKAQDARRDLLAALHAYRESTAGSPAGYQISSRLASLRDFPDAVLAANAVHDDEWNQRAWSTLAMVQADDGDYAGARKSINRIGRGPGLIHKLDMGPADRDLARERVAEILLAKDRAEPALTFLADAEEHSGIHDLSSSPVSVQALVRTGKLAEARSLVEKAIIDHREFLAEEDYALAIALVTSWYAADPAASESWVRAQTSPELQTSAWLALAREASGAKPAVYYYFVNWD